MCRRSEVRLALAASLTAPLALLAACTVESSPMLSPRDAGSDAVAPDAAPIDGGFTCVPDAPGCYGFVHYVCGDDGRTREEETPCEGACDPALGCVACTPGTFRCDGDLSLRCDDEHRWAPLRDCGEWGSECGGAGLCEDACGAAEAVRSNVGCEYWPVPLANTPELDRRSYDFRVVVANPGRDVASVTVTRGGHFVERASVVPGGVAELVLPWIDGVSFPFAHDGWQSVVTTDGAYRLTSTRPVIVSQFNPFHYASATAAPSYTNDASLLLPSHVLGREHFATTYAPYSRYVGAEPASEWADTPRYPGYLAIVGVAPTPTEVAVTLSGDAAADAGGRWPATARGATIRFVLARGEVAQIAAAVPPACAADRPGYHDLDPDEPAIDAFCREHAHDLTGSRVVSDRPVAVFGGHACANVPYDVPACDHLESQLAPVDTWGTRFATMPLRDPGTTVANLVRVVAARDGTTLTVDPPAGGGAATYALDAGDHVELTIAVATELSANAPIQIAQLLVGQNVSDPPLERGDPAMTVLVPEEQFRRDYVFVAPSSYAPLVRGQSYLLVSREPGTAITLDDRDVGAGTSWTRVGARELGVIPIGGGAHRLRASSPVGLVAYGLGLYTSYAYPAGLDLRVLPI